MSFYRPANYQSYLSPARDLPPPPPPPKMPPLPRGPPPPMNMYRGGDSWRPPDRETDISQRNEFTFRNHDRAPQYPRESDQYRPTRSREYAMRESEQARLDNQDKNECNRNDRTRRDHMNLNRHQRGRGYRIATADRPLLRLKRGETPEQMLGMTDDQNGARRFLPADDISDSAEEQMDESDSYSDQDQVAPSNIKQRDETVLPPSDMAQDRLVENTLEPARKKRALGSGNNVSKEETAPPKWSNPDPYTVLPPVDESQRKRKNVVKIIRKARIVSEKEAVIQSQVATNDDFISFGLEEDVPSADEATNPFSNGKDSANGIEGFPEAPKGSRQFSHLHRLHAQITDTPYTALYAPTDYTASPPLHLAQLRTEPDNCMLDIPDYNAALGNRKRTYNDEIKSELPYAKKRKPGFGMPSGSLAQEWIPNRDTDPTPWLNKADKPTEKAGFRLHKEICDFYEFVRPQKFEQTVREALLDRLQEAVRKYLPHCNIHSFGSFAAALYLPNADMDLVVISDQFRNHGQKAACQTNSQMRKFGRHLNDSQVAKAGSVEVIIGAKVPIIKFVDRVTSIKVDVSFENETGLIANETFSAWKRQFPAMPILVTLIKQFLMMRGLNEVMNGGLGGFSVTCLVISMLQNMPRVQTGEFLPEEHLGEMLIEFLDLYGNRFDISRTGIMMNPPGYFNKHDFQRPDYRRPVYQANKADRLTIMDPNKPDNDVSGGSRNVSSIFDRFSRAHEEILFALRSVNRPSLLDWLLGGNYEIFSWQRDHLRNLCMQGWGGPVQDSRELQAQIHNNSKRMGLGNFSAKEDISRLKSDISVNPTTLAVVNPFSETAGSAKNGVKFNPRKSNHNIGKNKTDVSKSKNVKKEKGTPQERPSDTAPSVLETKALKKKNNKMRASSLKREYPGVEDVGDSITKKRRQKVLAQHKARVSGGDVQIPAIV